MIHVITKTISVKTFNSVSHHFSLVCLATEMSNCGPIFRRKTSGATQSSTGDNSTDPNTSTAGSAAAAEADDVYQVR